uniref:Uncharacterized protein n=1 Tax=Tetraselmis sp. GSL018 TaxID=582737 RepID=A0A061RMD2_9CHLO
MLSLHPEQTSRKAGSTQVLYSKTANKTASGRSFQRIVETSINSSNVRSERARLPQPAAFPFKPAENLPRFNDVTYPLNNFVLPGRKRQWTGITLTTTTCVQKQRLATEPLQLQLGSFFVSWARGIKSMK